MYHTKIHIVDEYWTSKSCSRYQEINWELGGSRTFHCFHYGLTMDRDFNAALNIFLMNIEKCLRKKIKIYIVVKAQDQDGVFGWNGDENLSEIHTSEI